MKTIPVIRQNILDADIDVLIQQCNCYGVMGSGLAKQLKDVYPQVHEVDVAFPLPFGHERLGHYSVANVPHRVTGDLLQVVNAYAQVSFGRHKKQTDEQVLLGILRIILHAIKDQFTSEGRRITVGIPWKIGCGLGGGDWDLILSELTTIYNETGVDLRLYQI